MKGESSVIFATTEWEGINMDKIKLGYKICFETEDCYYKSPTIVTNELPTDEQIKKHIATCFANDDIYVSQKDVVNYLVIGAWEDGRKFIYYPDLDDVWPSMQEVAEMKVYLHG